MMRNSPKVKVHVFYHACGKILLLEQELLRITCSNLSIHLKIVLKRKNIAIAKFTDGCLSVPCLFRKIL